MTRIPDESNMERQLFKAKRLVERMPGGEDLFQIVCLKLVAKSDDIDWSNNQIPLICTAARNASIDMNRMSKVRDSFWKQSELLSPLTEHVRELPGPRILRNEARKVVRRNVDLLDEPYRSAIVAHFFEHKSPSEIARSWNVPVQTIKTRLRRAKELLRVGELRDYVVED